MTTMILTSLPEWRLLQGIGVATGGVKGRLARLTPKSSSQSLKQDSMKIIETNDLAFLETELRFLLMGKTPYAKPVQSTFDQFSRELESLCSTLESIVNPVLLIRKEANPDSEDLLDPINGYNTKYSKLWKLWAYLKASRSWGKELDLDLVDGPNSKLFLVVANRASQLLNTVTRCIELFLQLSAQETTSSTPNPALMLRHAHRSELLSGTEQNSRDVTITWLDRFNCLRREVLPRGYQTTIRIAVLDTGYKTDLKQNHRISNRVRRRWKDFVGVSTPPGTTVAEDTTKRVGDPVTRLISPAMEPLDEDVDLHGTCIVNLLHDLLPNSEIYVGRITKDVAGLAEASRDIAAAITHAADPQGWNADIITMSFGSSSRSKDIEDAIANAHTLRNRCILFFAAAGNDGGNHSELFPAALESVISVRGTYGTSGFIHEYNPDPKPEGQGRPLFGTLAYRVPCGPNDEEMSGCSIATPILAAIAAVFIEFAVSYASTQNWDEEQQRVLFILKTRAGMQELFKDIAGKANAANNRYYVAPELLFTTGKWGKPRWFNSIQTVCYKIEMPE